MPKMKDSEDAFHVGRMIGQMQRQLEIELSLEVDKQAESENKKMTHGYCAYHEIECDYKGSCIDCPHNTDEDVEWFRQDEELAESEGKNADSN